jgi:hypothetical protein
MGFFFTVEAAFPGACREILERVGLVACELLGLGGFRRGCGFLQVFSFRRVFPGQYYQRAVPWNGQSSGGWALVSSWEGPSLGADLENSRVSAAESEREEERPPRWCSQKQVQALETDPWMVRCGGWLLLRRNWIFHDKND